MPEEPKSQLTVRPFRANRPEESSGRNSAIRDPRILVLDITSRASFSATGQLKAAIFGSWEKDSYLQYCAERGKLRQSSSEQADRQPVVSVADAITAIEIFDPEIILYRPVPDPAFFHDFAMSVIERFNRPLVTWIMDDWPEDLRRREPDRYDRMNNDLRTLLTASVRCLSICDEMSTAFSQRYGVEFTAFANGIDPDEWSAAASPDNQPEETFVVRYNGSLAENMSRDSVLLCAQAVEELADEFPIRLDITTMPYWKDKTQSYFERFKHTRFLQQGSKEEYRAQLSSADAVLIAYNFDDVSVKYTQYSLANKLPECLASGAALVCIGPSAVATVATVERLGCGLPLTQPSLESLKAGIRKLRNDTDYYGSLCRASRKAAFEKFNIQDIRQKFKKTISEAAGSDHRGPVKRLIDLAERRYREIRRDPGRRGSLHDHFWSCLAYFLRRRSHSKFVAVFSFAAINFASALLLQRGESEIDSMLVAALCCVGNLIVLGLPVSRYLFERTSQEYSQIRLEINSGISLLRQAHRRRIDGLMADIADSLNDIDRELDRREAELLAAIVERERLLIAKSTKGG